MSFRICRVRTAEGTKRVFCTPSHEIIQELIIQPLKKYVQPVDKVTCKYVQPAK